MTILHVLDADIISAFRPLARNPRGSVAKRIAEVGADAIGVGAVTAASCATVAQKRNLENPPRKIEVILSNLTILALDVPQTPNMAGFARKLEAIGKTIGPNGLLIEAHARTLGCCAGDSKRAQVQQNSRAES